MTDHSVRSLLQTPGQSPYVTPVGLPHHLTAHLLSGPTHHEASAGHVTYDVTIGCDVTEVSVRLEHKELWDKFYALGTEMVITKSGR